jgi:hypothetical protein
VPEDERGERHSRDLLDQSELVKRRAKKRISESDERIARGQHRWMAISVGRVCTVCKVAQAKGEFDDDVACDAV